MRKKFSRLFVMFIALLLISELGLRLLGTHRVVTMKKSLRYEYAPKPNQSFSKFGNHIYYNEFAMRSSRIRKNSIKILGLGDSVINGGVPTDQNELATSILSSKLSAHFQKDIQFLNISAGSWGPDNVCAYFQELPNFNPKGVFLFVSSHDAFDNMTFDNLVFNTEDYRAEDYSTAIEGVFRKYLLRGSLRSTQSKNSTIDKKRGETPFNCGFDCLKNYADNIDAKFIIYLHPTVAEIQKGEFNDQGEMIIEFARENNISLITGLGEFKKWNYRDNIHLNASGQKLLAEIVFNHITFQMRDL